MPAGSGGEPDAPADIVDLAEPSQEELAIAREAGPLGSGPRGRDDRPGRAAHASHGGLRKRRLLE